MGLDGNSVSSVLFPAARPAVQMLLSVSPSLVGTPVTTSLDSDFISLVCGLALSSA